jgi:hypothetical protein
MTTPERSNLVGLNLPWLRWQALLVTLLWIVAACSGDSASSTQKPSCATPSRFGLGGADNEIRGTSRDASLWGLAVGPGRVPPRVGDELKIVWRMTGTGPLRVTFRAPDGTVRPLVFGPEAHSASTFDRPGDEWGSGFRFSTAGCWHIHFARADTSGDVWLDVVG